MNYLDIVITIPLIYGLIKGFTNGLIKEVSVLLGLIIGVYVAINFSFYLHPKFEEILGGYEQVIPIIAFATLFIVSVLMIKILGYIIDKLTKALALGFVSRILGAIFGFLKVVVIFSFLLAIVSDYNLIDKNTQEESVLINPIQEVSALINPVINKHKTTFLDEVEKSADEAKNKLNNPNPSE